MTSMGFLGDRNMPHGDGLGAGPRSGYERRMGNEDREEGDGIVISSEWMDLITNLHCIRTYLSLPTPSINF